MPKVQPFALPIGELAQVAEQSGLNWVNSDATKVAAIQAAIAAEPKPVHAPRERPPVVRLDDRPLVLVETRCDLRNMTLPFENTEQV
jgi:ribonuclease E